MQLTATPVCLNPTRDANGIIGPVDHRFLDEAYSREQIRRNPLVIDPEAWRRERPFRLAILTNTTYDGVCYNEREVLDRIGSLCDYILFDEAWMAYAKFHPLYNAEHEPEIVISPAAGHTALIRGDVDLVPLDELAGRVAASLIVVYPPGIAIMVPGERFADSAAVAYLRLFEENDNGRLRYYTYVTREQYRLDGACLVST